MRLMSIFQLPLEDPVIIFTLVLFIILLSPIILRKLRIPSIIGLIVAGIIIGPNGLNLLLRDSSIVLFGTVGLLYIMFLAALEIDMGDFKKSSKRSIIFGTLTFLIPLISGTAICYYLLQFSLPASILVASMFSTHTLISYPIVSNLGITKDESVTVSVGGTIITDTAVLMVLAIIVASSAGVLDLGFWVRMLISLSAFAMIILFGYPIIARWFFRNIPESGPGQYVFVLALVFLAGVLAELAGVEPIIGAFLAGLAINRLIPSNSALMSRIEFVGNAIFIPFFLISVGMLVDLSVIFSGTQALIVAATMTVAAILGKWLAAFFTQKIFGYSVLQRRIIFGLSTSHAAATLAVILIGFNIGLLDENVLNGTIILILITCMVSSFVTEQAGRKMAMEESRLRIKTDAKPERILVPVANPKNVGRLIELATYLKDHSMPEPIFPLSVVKDTEDAEEQLHIANQEMIESLSFTKDVEADILPTTRVDMNVSNGIIRAIKELFITTVVIGWNAKITARQWIFGSILDQLLERMNQMILVCKLMEPLNTYQQIVVVVTKAAQFEVGFINWLLALKRLANQIGTNIQVIAHQDDISTIESTFAKHRPFVETTFSSVHDPSDIKALAGKASKSSLHVFISSRRTTVSHDSYLDKIPLLLSRYFANLSFIVLYPKQSLKPNIGSNLQINEYSTFSYQKNLSRISRLTNKIKRIFGIGK
jgi:Kef-type K+ transport system membrane component KefB